LTKEVEHLLERIKREVELTKQESAKMRTTNDPFKDLLEFIEYPMDISVDAKSEPKIIDVSDEDNVECSDKITKLSSQTKKMHKSIIPAAAKLSDKKEPVTNSSKEKELDLFESRAKEGVSKVEEDAWAEVPGGLYQCLVCLASGLKWERRYLTEHLAIHKLTLVQYHNVFGPAIQRQLVKEKERTSGKILPKKDKNGKAEKDQKTPKEEIVAKDKEEKIDIIAIAASPQAKSRRQPLKKFECNICKEEFVWKEPNISDHLQQKHNLTKEFYFNLYVKGAENSEDKFNCDTCMFNSTRKSALTFHVDKYHTAIEKRTCCKKGFKTKWDLFVHLIENHKNDKELFAKMDIWQSLEKYYLKPST